MKIPYQLESSPHIIGHGTDLEGKYQPTRMYRVSHTHPEENQLLGAEWIDILERDGGNDRYHKPSPHHVCLFRKGVQF